MNPALEQMLALYPRTSLDEVHGALREVLQALALLGLWRGKFFEHAAFYGGTALRILHGLDRYSEDMDFSLLQPSEAFDLAVYLPTVENELRSWGFEVESKVKSKTSKSAVESAFLKANTEEHLLIIGAPPDLASEVPKGSILKVKVEVDTQPPPGFSTEARYCLLPIPFSVRVYTLPSLFAGKMHALLCRSWGRRVKGRDWYDFVWYVARNVELDIAHLEARMRQSGHFDGNGPLTQNMLWERIAERIARLDIEQARDDVTRFLSHKESVEVWSHDFFLDVARRVRVTPVPTAAK